MKIHEKSCQASKCPRVDLPARYCSTSLLFLYILYSSNELAHLRRHCLNTLSTAIDVGVPFWGDGDGDGEEL